MAVWYISTSGNNANPGTLNLPRRTFAGAFPLMSSGDTLFVRGGLYTDNIDTNSMNIPSGTSSAYTTIAGYPPDGLRAVTISNFFPINIPGPQNRAFISIENMILRAQAASDNAIQLGSNGAHHIRCIDIEATNSGHHGVFFHFPGSNFSFIRGSIHDNGDLNSWPTTSTSGPFHYGIYCEANNCLMEDVLFYNSYEFAIHCSNDNVGGNTDFNTFRRCTIHDASRSQLNDFSSVVLRNGSNMEFYNNVIYAGGAEGLIVQGTGVKVYNNTIYGCRREGIKISGASAIIRNNIVYNNALAGGTLQNIQNNSGTTTLSNNLTTNPSFVNAAAADFHLNPGSPAIDAGVSLASTFTTDHDGVSRPQGSAWDIGAYERPVVSLIPSAPTGVTIL